MLTWEGMVDDCVGASPSPTQTGKARQKSSPVEADRAEGAREEDICKMRDLIYNLLEFGCEGRRTKLKDYMMQHRLNVIGLQETIRQSFSIAE
jgi:hypothetical protein